MDELADERRRCKPSIQSLRQAAAGVPSPQIRNMGTVGGDLCQRPRCWYYRQGFGLLAMKDGKSLVPDGENQYHAIFGTRPGVFRQRVQPGPGAGRAGRQGEAGSAKGARKCAAGEILRRAAEREQRARSRCCRMRS